MESGLVELLGELEEFGASNDAATEDRRRKMLNITHDTGAFLALLVKACGSGNVLEIGTSNGYSTLWLADAVGEGGSITTVERDPGKVAMARRNLERAGLDPRVRQVVGEAGGFLDTCRSGEYDFIFVDADRERYVDWWGSLRRILAVSGLIVVDNTISHAHQLEEFTALIAASEGFPSSLCPIGNGELVILKDS